MAKGFTLTLQESRSIHDSMNIPKMISLLIFIFYYKYLKYEKYLKLSNSNIFVFKVDTVTEMMHLKIKTFL